MMLLDYCTMSIPNAYERGLDGANEKELFNAVSKVWDKRLIRCRCGKTVILYKGAVILEACDARVAIYRYLKYEWLPWSVAKCGLWMQQVDPLDMPEHTGFWFTPHMHNIRTDNLTGDVAVAHRIGGALDPATVKQVVRNETCLECGRPTVVDYSNMLQYDSRILDADGMARQTVDRWARIDTEPKYGYELNFTAIHVSNPGFYLKQHECGGR